MMVLNVGTMMVVSIAAVSMEVAGGLLITALNLGRRRTIYSLNKQP